MASYPHSSSQFPYQRFVNSNVSTWNGTRTFPFDFTKFCFVQTKALNAANIIVGLLVTVLNIGIIYSLLSSRSLRKHVYMVFLIALLVSHSFNGLSCIVIGLTSAIVEDVLLECNLMKWFGMIGRIIGSCDFLFVMLLTIDRVLSVKIPFRYNNLTRRYAAALILLAIGFNVFQFVMMISHFVEVQNLSSKVFSAVSVALIICNVLVYLEVRKQLEKMKITTSGNEEERKVSMSRLQKQKLKSIAVSLMFVVSFIVLWVPLIIVATMQEYSKTIFSKVLIMTLILIATFNAMVDPFIYIILNKKVRTELRRQVFAKLSIRVAVDRTTTVTESKVSH